MQAETQTASTPKAMFWIGWILSVLPALFLLFASAMNLVKSDQVVEGTVKYGYAESVIRPLGIVLLICVVIYLVPRTSVLGAILLTGYLGGAVATHVRAQEGLFTILFPVIFGALLWGGLVLRDAKLRTFLPLRR
jgi:DoxX-like protein